jgi:prolyl oligopeptidase
LIISVWQGTETKNLIFYKDLTAPESTVVELINEFEAEYSFIDNDGSLFWLQTDLNAPLGRVIAIDTNNPPPSSLAGDESQGNSQKLSPKQPKPSEALAS